MLSLSLSLPFSFFSSLPLPFLDDSQLLQSTGRPQQLAGRPSLQRLDP